MKRCKLVGKLVLTPNEVIVARRILDWRLSWLRDGRNHEFCLLVDGQEITRLVALINDLSSQGCALADDNRKIVVAEAALWLTRFKSHPGFSFARDRLDKDLDQSVTDQDVFDYDYLRSIVRKGASSKLKKVGALNI